MPQHDFRCLSPYDFECIVRDLLQAELRLTLETFASGRDNGIDLRHSRNSPENIIIQCKHYASTGFRKLLSHLKTKELPKIRKLNPTRYLLATSVGLTPGNKEEILHALSPHIASPQDIYGSDDLNNLLAKFPSIENNNIKLYITSWAALSRTLHNEIHSRTEGLLEDIEQKAKLYVPNRRFKDAANILEENHICIISGIPGIGKTTLAEMLILKYANQGYEVVAISADITEAEKLYNKNMRQIFYYDDFLGQVALDDKLPKNEDARLVKFLSRISKDQNKRIILTTREYLLNQATMRYEKLERYPLAPQKITIDLKDYTKLERAMILYNHLCFSEIPAEWKGIYAKSKRFHEIINHPNYIPRLIESALTLSSKEELRPSEFADFMERTFDKPDELWKHPFERQISQAARKIILTLATFPTDAVAPDLKDACAPILKFAPDQFETEFRDAHRLLEGSFIRTDLQIVNDQYGIQVIKLHNPSIRDFSIAHLEEHPEHIRLILKNAVFFDQCRSILAYAASQPPDSEPGLRAILQKQKQELGDALQRTFSSPACELRFITYAADREARAFKRPASFEARLALTLQANKELNLNIDAHWFKERLSALTSEWDETKREPEDCVRLLRELQLHSIWEPQEITDIAVKAANWIVSQMDFDSVHYEQFVELTEHFPDAIEPEHLDIAQEAFQAWFYGEIEESVFQAMDEEEVDEIVDWTRKIAEAVSFQIDSNWLLQAEKKAASLRSAEHGQRMQRVLPGIIPEPENTEDSSTSNIDSIFASLIDDAP
ncbi:restriction endonuclease [Pyxidicoccus sp. 3LFB2]